MVKKAERLRASGSKTKPDSNGTGRRRADFAVWRQVVDSLPTPIAVVDEEGTFVAANHAFRTQVPAAVAGNGNGNGHEPELKTAVRLALGAVDAAGFCAVSFSGLVFDCCRLEATRDLVALVGSSF